MDKLLRWKEESFRKPLLLKGVRQVGKTYLLKEFGKLHFAQYHYINFEKDNLTAIFAQDLHPHRILSELSFYLNSAIHVGKDLLIFDEIQELPRALTSLKYFAEECPELHICAAGSLLGLHLNSTAFPVGKVTFATLRPLSFEEFLLASEDKALSFFQKYTSTMPISQVMHDHLWQQLKWYFIVGGLPEVVEVYLKYKEHPFEAYAQVRKKQSDLVNAYYADISKHAGKVNAMHIDRIFRAVPMQLAQTADGSSKRFKFRSVVPGVSHYTRLAGAIDWLEYAGLIVKVHIVNTGHLPFKAYAKENFFKLFLFDVGILGYMSGLNPSVLFESKYGSFKGYFAENFVAQELLRGGQEELFCWEENLNETEFVLDIEGQVIPVEVKSGSNIKAKSLKAFAEKYHPSYMVLFSENKDATDRYIRYYPLYMAGRFSKSD